SGFSQLKSCFFADTTNKGAAAGYSMCKRGCVPLKVIVSDTCSGVYNTVPKSPTPLYKWGDAGNNFFESDTHTYFKPGVYTVEQLITPNSGATLDTIVKNYFTVLPNDLPAFTVSIC